MDPLFPIVISTALALLWQITASSAGPIAGERWLIAAAGAGIETVCVEYWHP